MPLTLQGYSGPAAKARVNALIEAVDLAEQADSLPRNMSAGPCQRVAMARALANDPDVILADEPTASLDAGNGQQIMRLLRELLQQHHKTALIVTHDQRVFPYADRVYWLNNGRLTSNESLATSH